jgi:hypothetical protein
MMPCMDSKTVKPSATLSTCISKEPSIRESSARPIFPHTGQKGLQPDDRWTPSHKYAPTVAPINVNLAATNSENVTFQRSEPPEQKNQARIAPSPTPRGTSARAARFISLT